MSNQSHSRSRLTRRDLLKLASVLSPGLLLMPVEAGTTFLSGAPFSVEFWDSEKGNFRARIQVPSFADAVHVRIPWRRRDPDPQGKGLFVHNAKTGKLIENSVAFHVNDEYGDLVFQPAQGAAEYYVYYMQYTADTRPWAYSIQYLPPPSKAAPEWLARHELASAQLSDDVLGRFPQAVFQEVQARTDFDRCDPMELVATAKEVESLTGQNPASEYLLFPTERQAAIRMDKHLPLRWVEYGPTNHFQGQACRGEFFTFQTGVWAVQSQIDSMVIEYKPLKTNAGAHVSAEAFRCFNLGGIDWAGRPFEKPFSVPQNEVRVLWIGIQIPADAEPGKYEGSLILKPKPGNETELHLSIVVEQRDLAEAGDNDLWRYSRLRWLDSKIGLDDKITTPYTPLQVNQDRVGCLLRNVSFAESGLPRSVIASNYEVLSGAVTLIVESEQGQLPMKGIGQKILSSRPDALTREYASTFGPIHCTCRFTMDFDGYINYALKLTSGEVINLRDIRLEIPYRAEVATHLMGLGKRGGLRPATWHWKWNIQKADNSLWIGNAQAGMQCKLKGSVDTWDSADLRANGIPKSWGNNGRGGWLITEESDKVISNAYSGPRTLQAGETIEFNFGLLATPVKPLDPNHWEQRYYHAYVDPEIAARAGANIVNIHQGNELNPFINYPFWTVDALAAYSNQAHERGLKVKIYYTVRELTNHAAELWALRSLGTEIYKDGSGGGSAWLREHLITGYTPAWHQMLPTGVLDSAILTTGLSRWHNYYLEGLDYLLRHAEIDGLYLDGIGYDRTIMRRVRRVLDQRRPGCLIDLHSGDAFPPFGISPADQYLEHFPYINSVWFGEGYNYDASPDFWLIEISGIPFGLFGEMLGNNSNPWRGMIYGMTTRYYQGADRADPHHIWKLWDDFGIESAKMLGYWDKECPIRTDNQDIFVTIYKKESRSLIAVASWSKQPAECRFIINWAYLGLNERHSVMRAPDIPGFQAGFVAKPDDKVLIQPGRGFLILLESTM